MRVAKEILLLILMLLQGSPLIVYAAELERWTISGRLVERIDDRQAVVPSAATGLTAPDYQWWYGCSPTAAGMLIGYYDINGYRRNTYENLVPGTIADTSTFPSVEGSWDYPVQHVIASQRHVTDFYAGGYLAYGDDVPGAPTGPLDSLADFMGTSMDAYDNANGGTSLWFATDGSRVTVADLYSAGISYYESSGSYGIYEFLRWAGYGDANPRDVDYIYNQLSDVLIYSGFSLYDYRAEIDAGRVVLLHIENHSMLGYGYDPVTGEILFHDTINEGENRMYWYGTYYGYILIGVTVVDLTSVAGDPKTAPPGIGGVLQLLLPD